MLPIDVIDGYIFGVLAILDFIGIVFEHVADEVSWSIDELVVTQQDGDGQRAIQESSVEVIQYQVSFPLGGIGRLVRREPIAHVANDVTVVLGKVFDDLTINIVVARDSARQHAPLRPPDRSPRSFGHTDRVAIPWRH